LCTFEIDAVHVGGKTLASMAQQGAACGSELAKPMLSAMFSVSDTEAAAIRYGRRG
jgi:hypothetical protein